MMGDLQLLATLIIAALLGAIVHEVAHWIVWRVTGRQPRLDLWELYVEPRAGPRRTTPGDRVAAAAPYVLGACCLFPGIEMGVLPLIVFGGAMIQIPSRVDVATMCGWTEWILADSQSPQS